MQKFTHEFYLTESEFGIKMFVPLVGILMRVINFIFFKSQSGTSREVESNKSMYSAAHSYKIII